MVKAKELGQFGYSCPKNQSTSFPCKPNTTTTQILMLLCLLGKFSCIPEQFSFCARLQTFLTTFHSRVQLGFLMKQHFFLNAEYHLSLYILHVKYIKIISLCWEHFQCWSKKSVDPQKSVDPKNLLTHKCVPTSSRTFVFKWLPRRRKYPWNCGLGYCNRVANCFKKVFISIKSYC